MSRLAAGRSRCRAIRLCEQQRRRAGKHTRDFANLSRIETSFVGNPLRPIPAGSGRGITSWSTAMLALDRKSRSRVVIRGHSAEPTARIQAVHVTTWWRVGGSGWLFSRWLINGIAFVEPEVLSRATLDSILDALRRAAK